MCQRCPDDDDDDGRDDDDDDDDDASDSPSKRRMETGVAGERKILINKRLPYTRALGVRCAPGVEESEEDCRCGSSSWLVVGVAVVAIFGAVGAIQKVLKLEWKIFSVLRSHLISGNTHSRERVPEGI